MRLSNVHAPVVNGWMQKEPLVSRNTNRKGKADQILCRFSFTLPPLFFSCSVLLNFFSFSFSPLPFPSHEEEDGEQQEPIAILLLHFIALHDVLHVSVHCHCAFRPAGETPEQNKGSLRLLSRCCRALLVAPTADQQEQPL